MADDLWTVQRILDWIEGYLSQRDDANARLSAQWLVSEALGVSRMQLFLDARRPLSADERARLRDWTRRRGSGEPLQYITGETAFRHITVRVRPGVLIPRPETEVLVSEALALLPAVRKPQDELDDRAIRQFAEYCREEGNHEALSALEEIASDALAGQANKRKLYVADICTGTGCIACSLAREHPRVHVVASDVSPEAVALARENAAALGLSERIDVLECDLGAGVDEMLLGNFDLVVSNPPYIPSALLEEIPAEVTDYEPRLALDGGEDGLAVFRRLLSWCQKALKPNGAFAFELHEACLDRAADEARSLGFSDLRAVRDLADKPRVLTGRKS